MLKNFILFLLFSSYVYSAEKHEVVCGEEVIGNHFKEWLDDALYNTNRYIEPQTAEEVLNQKLSEFTNISSVSEPTQIIEGDRKGEKICVTVTFASE